MKNDTSNKNKLVPFQSKKMYMHAYFSFELELIAGLGIVIHLFGISKVFMTMN